MRLTKDTISLLEPGDEIVISSATWPGASGKQVVRITNIKDSKFEFYTQSGYGFEDSWLDTPNLEWIELPRLKSYTVVCDPQEKVYDPIEDALEAYYLEELSK